MKYFLQKQSQVLLHVLMAPFVLLVELPTMKEGLRYATEISGVLYVVMAGIILMHKWCVDSLDLQLVYACFNYGLI